MDAPANALKVAAVTEATVPVVLADKPRKKWPEVFPEFVGRGFFEGEMASGTGKGRCTAETWYSDYEENKTDPTVFRMKYRNTVKEYGAGASPEMLARVGVCEVSWRYFQADHERGCFKLLGGLDLEDECEKIEKGKNKGKRIVPFSLWAEDHDLNGNQTTAGWAFRTNKRQQLQLLLSDDFTVLRGVNKVDPKTGEDKTDGFLDNASYRFGRAATTGLKIAADLLPLADNTKEKIDFLQEIFREGNEFRKEDEKDKLEVKVDARFVNVNRIDTLEDQFGAEAKVVFQFQIKKSDAAEYVGAGNDKARWVPAGAPKLGFEELNQAVGVQAAPVKIVPGPFILQRDGNIMVARQTITITGDFYESFELENYPFDSQPLRIRLRSTGTMVLEGFKFVHGALFEEHEGTTGQRGGYGQSYVAWDDEDKEGTVLTQSTVYCISRPGGNQPDGDGHSAWECDCACGSLDPQHTAWQCDIDKPPKMMVEFKKRTASGKRLNSFEGKQVVGVLGVTLAILVSRNSAVYVKRVMMTLAGFALLAIFSFATEEENAVESILTVMLTAVAFSVVIAEDIPKLGYLTFLDKYVLGLTTGFIVLLSWVMWTNMYASTYDIQDDYCCWTALWTFASMYVVVHAALFVHVRRQVLPHEAEKYKIKTLLRDCLIGYKAEKPTKKTQQLATSPAELINQ